MKKLLPGLILLVFFGFFEKTVYADQLNITVGLVEIHNLSEEEIHLFNELFHTPEDENEPESEGENPTPEDMLRFIKQLESELWEVTFDEYRTVTGTAPYTTTINLVLLTYKNDDSEESETKFHSEEHVVGLAGVFSLDVPLAQGYNIVILIFTTEDTVAVMVSQINRMDMEIKLELGNPSLTLPGIPVFDGILGD